MIPDAVQISEQLAQDKIDGKLCQPGWDVLAEIKTKRLIEDFKPVEFDGFGNVGNGELP